MPKEKKTKNLPKKVEDKGLVSNKEYKSTLTELKKQIRESQVKAIVAANQGADPSLLEYRQNYC
jgi:outer membrane lipopolysaccharide assembly protein LptE/RlpB